LDLLFENRLIWQLEAEKSSTNGYFKLRINETAEHLTSTQSPSLLNGSC